MPQYLDIHQFSAKRRKGQGTKVGWAHPTDLGDGWVIRLGKPIDPEQPLHAYARSNAVNSGSETDRGPMRGYQSAADAYVPRKGSKS